MSQHFVVHAVPVIPDFDLRHVAIVHGTEPNLTPYRYSLNRIRYQICHHLGYLAERAVNRYIFSAFDQNIDLTVFYLAGEELQYVFEKIPYCLSLWSLDALLRPSKCLLRNPGDSLQLTFCRFNN